MKRVLITNWVPDEHIAPLLGRAEILKGPKGGQMCLRTEVLALAPTLDAIINQHELQVDRELLAAGPGLQIIANVAAGFNNIDIAALDAAGVWATNTPGVFTEAAADHTLCLLLAVARRQVEADTYVRSGRWKLDGFQPGPWDGMLLAEKTLGIVGYGKIGRAVAHRARAFGMQVVFHTTGTGAGESRVSMDELFTRADVVSLHCPLVDATRHLINEKTIAKMKDGVLLLNLARGPVVDETALIAALQSGKIAGAGLDVFEFEPEPLPALLAMPNVVLSPHMGGGTRESRKAARLLCAQNISQVFDGLPPVTPVNRPRLIPIN